MSSKKSRKSDSRIKKRLDKRSKEFKRRSAAAKLGWYRRRNRPQAIELYHQLQESADKLKVEIVKRDRTIDKLSVQRAIIALAKTEPTEFWREILDTEMRREMIKTWQEMNKEVIESFALLQEVSLKEIYDAIFY